MEVVEEVGQVRQVSFANQQIEALNTPSLLNEEPLIQYPPVNKPPAELIDLIGEDQPQLQPQPQVQPVVTSKLPVNDLLDMDGSSTTASQVISQPVSSNLLYQ